MPKPNVIIHLAGLKAVAESIDMPTKYYENNLVSTINIIKIMESFYITNLIFSSSATVYGSATVPYTADSHVGIGIINPYGRSKYLRGNVKRYFIQS
jgi:UDP-glucose 4-epimerase